MIELRNLSKVYRLQGRRKVVADRINAVFPTGKAVGLMGRNGAGKSTLLKMIAGTVDVTSGQILSDGNISFPVGFAGSFHPDMTGRQNTLFVARTYGVSTEGLMEYVQDFAELGPHFELPLRSYSSGMRSRLAFGVSMGLQFDTYLIDEITAVGDASFRRKSRAVFMDRLQNSGVLFVSHSVGMLREMCEAGAVLENGTLRYFDDVNEAIELHAYNMAEPAPVVRSRGPAPEKKKKQKTAKSKPKKGFPAQASMMFCIGAQKAGTSWLRNTLQQSPEVHFSIGKETHYFDVVAGVAPAAFQNRVKAVHQIVDKISLDADSTNARPLQQLQNAVDMLSMFAVTSDKPKAYVEYLKKGYDGQAVIADFTSSYAILAKESFEQMAAIGAAKFVFIMRDPVERFWAQLQIDVAAKIPDEMTFQKACEDKASKLIEGDRLANIERSNYENTIIQLEQAVPADRIKYLFYEDLSAQSGMDDLCSFLGIGSVMIDAGPQNDEEQQARIPEGLRRSIRAAFDRQYSFVRGKFGATTPSSWAP